MPSHFMERTIFVLDDKTTRGQYKFTQHADRLYAMNKLKAKVRSCVLRDEQKLFSAYMAVTVDYEKHFRGFCLNNTYRISVPGDQRQDCTVKEGKDVWHGGPIIPIIGRYKFEDSAYIHLLDTGKTFSFV